MKTLKKQIKLIAKLFALVVLLQSCTVYKTRAVTLEDASKHQIKSRLETYNGVNFHFKRIIYENGNYFGIRKSKGEIIKIKLNENHIKSIKLKDKTLSTILTIVIPIAVISIGVLIFKDEFMWKPGTIDFRFQNNL